MVKVGAHLAHDARFRRSPINPRSSATKPAPAPITIPFPTTSKSKPGRIKMRARPTNAPNVAPPQTAFLPRKKDSFRAAMATAEITHHICPASPRHPIPLKRQCPQWVVSGHRSVGFLTSAFRRRCPESDIPLTATSCRSTAVRSVRVPPEDPPDWTELPPAAWSIIPPLPLPPPRARSAALSTSPRRGRPGAAIGRGCRVRRCGPGRGRGSGRRRPRWRGGGR